MKGFKDKSGKFRPTENKNGVRKSRDQSTKTQGVRLARVLRVEDNPHAKVKTELVTDIGSEMLYKIIDVNTSPEIDKPIPSNLFVHIINMEEATGDEFDPDKKYVGEVILMPKWKYINPELKKSVADSGGFSLKDFEEQTGANKGSDNWVLDMMFNTGGIRLGDDESSGDPDELRHRLANKAPAYAGMIGFFLDETWNRIGTTGWDSLNHLTKNTDVFGGK